VNDQNFFSPAPRDRNPWASPWTCARVPPLTANQLHAWLRLVVNVDVPRLPMEADHQAPFDYLLHTFFEHKPAQAPRDCVVWANRGGGKTFLGAVATMLDLVFKPGIEVRILGGSLEQSQRMHAHLRDLFARPALRPLLAGRITDRRVRLRNGSLCEVLAQSQASVRGVRPQKIRCDEVELFDSDIWRAAQLVTRSKQCGPTYVHGAVEALSTMHRAHGLMAEVLADAAPIDDSQLEDQASPPRRRLFRWSVLDVLERCPPARPCQPCELLEECGSRAKDAAGFFTIDDALRAKARSSESVWRAEMLCQTPRRDDLVLPEFDRSVHVGAFEPPMSGEWIAGVDFGFRSPTVILWAKVDEQGTVRIVDERTRQGVILHEHLQELLAGAWPRPAWVGVDPAGRQRNDQTGLSAVTAMRRAGLTVRDRRCSVEQGLRLIRARLAPATGGPTLFVHTRCENLIHSLQTYHYPPEKPESREPVKDGADHAVDALRYLVVNLDRPAASTRVRKYI